MSRQKKIRVAKNKVSRRKTSGMLRQLKQELERIHMGRSGYKKCMIKLHTVHGSVMHRSTKLSNA
jgi:hypothetical protein